MDRTPFLRSLANAGWDVPRWLRWTAFLGWAAVTFVNLYFFSGAGLDDWCYFAPAVASPRPLALRLPLVGDFLGGDHVWGIHWPGAPLLYSVLLPALRWLPLALVRVGLFMALWAAAAWLTARLLRAYLRSPVLAWVGAALVLVDRGFLGIALMARPELLSMVVFLASVLGLRGLEDPALTPSARRRQWLRAGTGVGGFLLPLLHPLLVGLGGVLCLHAVVRGFRDRRRPGRLLDAAMLTVGYAAGVAALAAWFLFQPDALAQFRIHAAAGYHPFSFGGTLLDAVRTSAPLYSVAVLYLLAFAMCARLLWRRWRGEGWDTIWVAAPTLPVLLFAAGLVVGQAFGNPLYLGLLLPFTALLALGFLAVLRDRFCQRQPARAAAADFALPAALLALCLLHGAHWAGRGVRFVRAGRWDMRGEMRAIVRNLPPAGTVLIPDQLWEEALRPPAADVAGGEPRRRRYFLYTLAFGASDEERLRYERYVFGQTKSGDLLLLSRLQHAPLTSALSEAEWEPLDRFQRVTPGSIPWGYDLTLYRKR